MLFRSGVGGQHDFRMDNAALPGVIMGQAVPFIRQFGSASVGGCGNSGTALAALDDTDGKMTKIYGWHLLSAGIFQAPWSRTDAKRVFGCAGRTRGLGSVAPHRARRAQQPSHGVPAKTQRSGFRGERRSKGAGAVFAARRKRRQADFATTRAQHRQRCISAPLQARDLQLVPGLRQFCGQFFGSRQAGEGHKERLDFLAR